MMKRLRSKAFISFSLALVLTISLRPSSAPAQSDDLLNMTVEGTSGAASAIDAAKEISDRAIAQAAREQAIEIIGEKKYAQRKSLVEGKIVGQSSKFIPYSNSGEPTRGPDNQWHMQIELRISRSSLRGLIAQTGLLVDSTDGPASVLPFMTVVDRVGNSIFRWWQPDSEPASKFSQQISELFSQSAYAELSKVGFYVIRPQAATVSMMPEALRSERLNPNDMASLGNYFHAQILITGETRLEPSPELSGGFRISVRLSATQTANGRSIAEAIRTYEADPGSFENAVRAKLSSAYPEVCKDLGAQMLEVWQKGSLGANLIQLVLRGKLGPKQLDSFKASLLREVREVKSVRERLFEPGQTTLEAESSASPAQLAERLRSVQLPGFQSRVASATDKGVVVEISAR